MPEIFICIKTDTELNETTPVIAVKRFHVDFYMIKKIIQNTCQKAHKMIHAHSDWFKQCLSSNIILIHISIMMFCTMTLLLTHDHQKSKNTTSEYIVQNLEILEILLILSEFNQTDIHRSVWQFHILLVTLWMHIKKAHHERNQENTWTTTQI